MLCCAVYDASKFTIGNFMSCSLAKLQELKHKAEICRACINEGIPRFFVYGDPMLEALAVRNLARYYKQAGICLLDAAIPRPSTLWVGRIRPFLVKQLEKVPWLYQLARRVRDRFCRPPTP